MPGNADIFHCSQKGKKPIAWKSIFGWGKIETAAHAKLGEGMFKTSTPSKTLSDWPQTDKEKYVLWRDEFGGFLLSEPKKRRKLRWALLTVLAFSAGVSAVAAFLSLTGGRWFE